MSSLTKLDLVKVVSMPTPNGLLLLLVASLRLSGRHSFWIALLRLACLFLESSWALARIETYRIINCSILNPRGRGPFIVRFYNSRAVLPRKAYPSAAQSSTTHERTNGIYHITNIHSPTILMLTSRFSGRRFSHIFGAYTGREDRAVHLFASIRSSQFITLTGLALLFFSGFFDTIAEIARLLLLDVT